MRFDPNLDNVLSQQDDELHNILRTKMAAGVSLFSALRSRPEICEPGRRRRSFGDSNSHDSLLVFRQRSRCSGTQDRPQCQILH